MLSVSLHSRVVASDVAAVLAIDRLSASFATVVLTTLCRRVSPCTQTMHRVD